MMLIKSASKLQRLLKLGCGWRPLNICRTRFTFVKGGGGVYCNHMKLSNVRSEFRGRKKGTVTEAVEAGGRIGQSGIDLLQPATCREHPTHSWGSRAFSSLARSNWDVCDRRRCCMKCTTPGRQRGLNRPMSGTTSSILESYCLFDCDNHLSCSIKRSSVLFITSSYSKWLHPPDRAQTRCITFPLSRKVPTVHCSCIWTFPFSYSAY